ncbi:MAG: DegT/DnrJ/EryC1/StrS family aminotransferase, partial [Oscillospiraceae bacterium]|nr:DegT/DnrJ/EryC1/StrS family aminotransferase [Oscillospiraceae bacterium]
SVSNRALLGGKPLGKPDLPTIYNGFPIYGQEELDAVQEVVKSLHWGTNGPKQVEFEEAFAKFIGTKYAANVTNGTHTLRLALEALGVGPGDEVIVPGSTWQGTAASVLDVNAMPILTDADPRTWCISPERIEENITPRTKAIIPVHLYSRICDMDAILDIAKRYNLVVIEDCAHQHGSEWKGKKAGTMGATGSFSLQCSKIMQTGEGGMVTTNDERLYDLIYSLKFCGRSRDPKSETPLPTMQSGNFRGNEFAAAIGICQLARLQEQNDLRGANITYLEDALQAEIPGLTYLYRDPRVTYQAHYRMSMRFDKEAWDGVHRDTVIKAVKAETEDELKLVKPYAPLNNSSLYRPFSKKTHKLSDEYMRLIDPARFHMPVVERLYKEEYLGFDHPMFLDERGKMDRIVEIFKKLYANIPELKKFQEEVAL